ncbi:uncharacterized protein LOC123317657 [Coccinella septempunctata]|uniref:uncharacterized protein LOC123317657 n=1 Tax=Coccinella septempunctata TaxID=41139 RepID=UPI001D098DBD|nr:uncharacterized protein LOC123317657 [Coccinella septempunctata]
MEISFTIKRIGVLSSNLEQLKTKLSGLVPEGILERFLHTQNKSYKTIYSNNNKNLNKKFWDLKKQKIQSIKIKDEWLHNLTTTQIPTDIKVILSLGPKFSIAPLPIIDSPIKNIIADVENIIGLAPTTTQNILRAKCTNAITNYVHTHKGSHSFEHHLFTKAKKYTRAHDDLIITAADKGNITVVLSVDQYEHKMNLLLQDSSIYKQLTKDPTNETQNKNNKIIKQLKDLGIIDGATARQLTTYKAVPPRIYGLPKIHKPDIPLRPIVSTIGSPTAELSHFMTRILTEAFSNFISYSIADSFQFSRQINNLILPQGYKLVSLDAVSLFTNISLDLVMQIIQSEWSRIQQITVIEMPLFLSIIKFLFDSSYFTFRGSFFSQIFGCAMGNKISSILALIIMTVLLNYCIPLLPFHTPIVYQYVDDLLLAIPDDMTAETLTVFNSFDQHIKFTVEEETDNGVPFLDTKVVRCTDNVIKLDWYQKPTSSGRYIHYKSNHSWSVKTNLIKGMFKRVKNICHPDFLKSAEERLLNIFEDNGYPRMFLERCLHALPLDLSEDGSPTEEPATTDQNEPIKYVSLPLLPSLTRKLTNILKDVKNIKIAKYNPLTVGRIFSHVKDRIPIMSKSDVVYRISCGNCNSVYIGQTSQCLKKRIAIHKSDAKLRPDRCALANHASSLGHKFKFDEAEILCLNSDYNKRTFLEMCFINENENNINRKTDLGNLSAIYSYILSLDKRPADDHTVDVIT